MCTYFEAPADVPAHDSGQCPAAATGAAIHFPKVPFDLSDPRIRMLPIRVLALAIAGRKLRDGIADTV